MAKPEPMTVMVKAGPPGEAEFGDRLDRISVDEGLIVNRRVFEMSPPGFITLTLAVPGEAIRLAGTKALNWLEAMYPVDNAAPFHSTMEPVWKPEPNA